MLKNTFPFLDKDLNFNSQKHEYTYKSDKYISVTGWLNSFEPPFNPYEISKQVSKNPNSEYYKMDPSVIRKLWQGTAARGTKCHHDIEQWITGERKMCKYTEFLKELGIKASCSWSEVPLVSRQLKLAGTADIISYDKKNDKYIIWDIKTTKKITPDVIKKFSKQIFIYCIILRQMTENKIKIIPGGIISIKPSKFLSEGLLSEFDEPEFIDIDMSIANDLRYMIKRRLNEIK